MGNFPLPRVAARRVLRSRHPLMVSFPRFVAGRRLPLPYPNFFLSSVSLATPASQHQQLHGEVFLGTLTEPLVCVLRSFKQTPYPAWFSSPAWIGAQSGDVFFSLNTRRALRFFPLSEPEIPFFTPVWLCNPPLRVPLLGVQDRPFFPHRPIHLLQSSPPSQKE